MNMRLLARPVLLGMVVLTLVPGQCSPLRGPVETPPCNKDTRDRKEPGGAQEDTPVLGG